MNVGRVKCTICEAMILPETSQRNNGLCAQCIKDPAYAQLKVDHARARMEGRDLRDETDDPQKLRSILLHELETSQYKKIENNTDTYPLPEHFALPPIYQKLLKNKAIALDTSFGNCDMVWIKPSPLIKEQLRNVDHSELYSNIVQSMKGFENYVAFAWKLSGEFYCWDTSRPTNDGEYVICIAGSGASDDYAPNTELCLLREVIEKAYSDNVSDEDFLSAPIEVISSSLSSKVAGLMREMNSQLRAVNYDYFEYKKTITQYLGESYL